RGKELPAEEHHPPRARAAAADRRGDQSARSAPRRSLPSLLGWAVGNGRGPDPGVDPAEAVGKPGSVREEAARYRQRQRREGQLDRHPRPLRRVTVWAITTPMAV